MITMVEKLHPLLDKNKPYFDYKETETGEIETSCDLLGYHFGYIVPEDEETGCPLLMSTEEGGLFALSTKPHRN